MAIPSRRMNPYRVLEFETTTTHLSFFPVGSGHKAFVQTEAGHY